MLVTNLVERRHFVGREASGLGKDRVDQILGKVAEQSGIERGLEAGDMLQRERDLIDGRAIHGFCPLRLLSIVEWEKAGRHSPS